MRYPDLAMSASSFLAQQLWGCLDLKSEAGQVMVLKAMDDVHITSCVRHLYHSVLATIVSGDGVQAEQRIHEYKQRRFFDVTVQSLNGVNLAISTIKAAREMLPKDATARPHDTFKAVLEALPKPSGNRKWTERIERLWTDLREAETEGRAPIGMLNLSQKISVAMFECLSEGKKGGEANVQEDEYDEAYPSEERVRDHSHEHRFPVAAHCRK